MLVSVSVLFSIVLEARVKSQTILEIEQQGAQAASLIGQTIRNAEAITSPAPGSSSSSLTLDVVSAGADPTVFDLIGNTMRITEGGTVSALTNSRVTVSGLNFQNLTRSGTAGALRTSFTLTHYNPDNRKEYDYEKTFNFTASLRP